MIKWIKKLFTKKPKVYCVNCEHCRPDSNFSGIDSLKFAKCTAPQNIKRDKVQTETLKLVVNGKFTDTEIDDSIGIKYDCEYCTIQRKYNYSFICGKKGRWYTPKKEEENQEKYYAHDIG